MKDYRVERYEGCMAFHVAGMRMDEVDPAAPALKFLAKELNMDTEQKYWLAFLYGCSYCVATAYQIFKEFPSLNKILQSDIDKWWKESRKRLVFESDRVYVKSNNAFPKMVRSYADFCRGGQKKAFAAFMKKTPEENYTEIFNALEKRLYFFGRFSLFTYLEALFNITGLPMRPMWIDLRGTKSLSTLNGLLFALGRDDLVSHASDYKPLNESQYKWAEVEFRKLHDRLLREHPEIPTTYWNLETSLCAYKKLFFNTRYVGYYIDRQMVEIYKMQRFNPDEDYSLLWNFRASHFHPGVLGELNGWNGIRHEMLTHFTKTGSFGNDMPSADYQAV